MKPDPPKGRSTAGRKETSKEARLLVREKLRRAEALVGTARGTEPERDPVQRPETRRSPGSAAGRNKPARQRAEKAIKAVRNREGGTGPDPWQGRAEAKAPEGGKPPTKPSRSGRRLPMSMEWRSLNNPKRVARCKPGRTDRNASSSISRCHHGSIAQAARLPSGRDKPETVIQTELHSGFEKGQRPETRTTA